MNAKADELRALSRSWALVADLWERIGDVVESTNATAVSCEARAWANELDLNQSELPRCICCGQPVIARCLGYTDGGWAGVCEAAYHDHFVGPVETSADKALAAYAKLAAAVKAYGVKP